MALSSSPRALRVPAADVLAKNMRALDAARVPPSKAASEAGGASSSTMIGIGRASEDISNESRIRIRFRRAAEHASPSPIAAILAKLFPKKPSQEEKQAAEAAKKAEISPFKKLADKVLPVLEKTSAIASRSPDPIVLFLALVLLVLLVTRVKPQWLASLFVKIALVASFLPLFILALLWRKTELFTTLREGHNPLSHPTEHAMDVFEAELNEREERVKKAEEELKKNRAQLDALRKELAKDPHARDADAIIVPSRTAAAMIAAGALGAGYDAEAAQAVEQKRREESVKRSREEWRVRTEEAECDAEQTDMSLKLMADHAATAYRKRTKELKTRSSSGGGLKNAERLKNLRKVGSVINAIKKEEESVDIGGVRLSERSAAVSTTISTGSKRRGGLFRRRRRTGGQGEDDVPGEMGESV